MIKISDSLPKLPPSPQGIRLLSLFSNYPDELKLWVQDEKTYIGMLDGNVTLVYGGTDTEELCEFLKILSPVSVFSGEEFFTAAALPLKRVNAVKKEIFPAAAYKSDTLKSDQIYEILEKGGLPLPPYEYFAPDFCRRLNRGGLIYCGIKDTASAIGIKENENLLITGIASLKKGYGSRVLCSLLSLSGCKTAFAVCEDEILPFYLKNGFSSAGFCGIYTK